MVKHLYLLLALVCAAWWGRGNGSQIRTEFEDRKNDALRNMVEQSLATRLSPPSYEGNQPLLVNLTYFLGQIVDMDERTGRLETSGFLYMQWKDERLAYPSDVGVDFMNPVSEQIWTPDMALYNAVYPGLKFLNQPDLTLAMKDGTVIWVPQVSTFTLCHPASDPLPTQSFSCTLKFGSWVYDVDTLVLNATTALDSLSHYVMSPYWEITDASLSHRQETYFCCPNAYDSVSLTITIQRRTPA